MPVSRPADTRSGASGRKCRRAAVSREQREQHEPRKARDLEECEHVLHAGTLPDAAGVDEREPEQHTDADRLFHDERHRVEQLEVQQERAGERRHGPRDHHEHDRPAIEKRPERPVGLAHVDVEAARLRQHRAELRERQRSAEHEQPREHPDGDHDARFGNLLGNQRGHDEDPRSDDRSDQQRRAVEESQLAGEVGRSAHSGSLDGALAVTPFRFDDTESLSPGFVPSGTLQTTSY